MNEVRVVGVTMDNGTIDCHRMMVNPAATFIKHKAIVRAQLRRILQQFLIVLIKRWRPDPHRKIQAFGVVFRIKRWSRGQIDATDIQPARQALGRFKL